LAIQGADDQYGTPLQITEIKRLSPAPVELLLLADCQHSPQFEQSERSLQAISEFVLKHTISRARA
jgi:pimeloyl-ACP methyl ester carboxylesterase